MFVCCECCVLSGRCICDELITRPEESYRLWCVVVCDLENFKNEEALTRFGSQRHRKKDTFRWTLHSVKILFRFSPPRSAKTYYLQELSILSITCSQICLSLTLVDLQLDEQNSCLFTCNTFIKILYMFRALPCSSSGGLRRNCIYAASVIVTLCRWLSCAPVKKEASSFVTDAQDSHLQTVTIPEAAYIQLRRIPPEDEQSNARNM